LPDASASAAQRSKPPITREAGARALEWEYDRCREICSKTLWLDVWDRAVELLPAARPRPDVDEVARAIRIVRYGGAATPPWSSLNRYDRESYRVEARAAIDVCCGPEPLSDEAKAQLEAGLKSSGPGVDLGSFAEQDSPDSSQVHGTTSGVGKPCLPFEAVSDAGRQGSDEQSETIPLVHSDRRNRASGLLDVEPIRGMRAARPAGVIPSKRPSIEELWNVFDHALRVSANKSWHDGCRNGLRAVLAAIQPVELPDDETLGRIAWECVNRAYQRGTQLSEIGAAIRADFPIPEPEDHVGNAGGQGSDEHGVSRYLEIVDELVSRRTAEGKLSDDEEERFATALSDCRTGMTQEEQDRLTGLIVGRPFQLAAQYERRLVQYISENDRLKNQVTELQARMTAMLEEHRAERAQWQAAQTSNPAPTCKTCGTIGRLYEQYVGAYFCVMCNKWLQHNCGGSCQFCKDQPAVPLSRLL
jgi:hypothetical protein